MRGVKKSISMLLSGIMVFSCLFGAVPTMTVQAAPEKEVHEKAAGNPDDVTLYPQTPKAIEATDYTLTVNGKKVFIEDKVQYSTKVRDDFSTKTARLIHSGDGPLDVVLTVPGGKDLIKSEVYPRRANVYPVVDEKASTISFTIEPEMMKTSMQYIIKIPGKENLILIVDPPETDKPSLDDANVYNLMDQPGVKNDGTKCTEAIQAAIDHVGTTEGLDILYVPNGHYVTGRLEIKHDNVAIYLESGVLIQGAYDARSTGDLEKDYPFGETGFGHNDRRNGSVFIQPMGKRTLVRDEVNGDHYEVEAIKNFKLYGRGVIDGSGRQIYENVGGGNDNQANWIHLFEAKDVDGLEVKDVILRNSSNWCFKLENVNNAKINNLKVINSTVQRYADGMDLSSVTNATYENSMSYSQDDAIAIMTLQLKNPTNTGYDGPPQGKTENVTFKNHLGYTDCSAVRIGWDSTDEMNNLNFDGCEWVKYDAGGFNIHRLQDNNKYGPITFKNCRWDNADNPGMKTFATCYGTDGNGFSTGEINAEEIRWENCIIDGLTKGAFNIKGKTIDKVVFDSTRMSNGTETGLVTKKEEIPKLNTSGTTFEFTDTYGIAEKAEEGRYQAETMPLLGKADISTNAAGYEGFGFVRNMDTIGSGLTFTMNAEKAGNYDLTFRYSTLKDVDNMELYVNGTKIKNIHFASTDGWQNWADYVETVSLKEGKNTIQLKAANTTESTVCLDYIDVTEASDEIREQDVVLNENLEAEAAKTKENVEIVSDASASQTRAVEFAEVNDKIEYSELKGAAERLTIRYRSEQDTTLNLYNGTEKVTSVFFPETGKNWGEVVVNENFAENFKLGLVKEAKDAKVQVDYVKFESGNPALVNLALCSNVTTNRDIANNQWSWYGVRNAVDGASKDGFSFRTTGAGSADDPSELLIDLEQVADVYQVNLISNSYSTMEVYMGESLDSMKKVADAQPYSGDATIKFNQGQDLPISARYVKLSVVSGTLGLDEVEVMGVKTGEATDDEFNVAKFKSVTENARFAQAEGKNGYHKLNDWYINDEWAEYLYAANQELIITYDLLQDYNLHAFTAWLNSRRQAYNAEIEVKVRPEGSAEWKTAYVEKPTQFTPPSDFHSAPAMPIRVDFDESVVGRYVQLTCKNITGTNRRDFAVSELEINGSLVKTTGVEINKSSLILKPQSTAKLEAVVTPADACNQNVSWSSSDTSVATVDKDGIVTAVANGTAVITARTADGFKDTCKVMVTDNIEPSPIKKVLNPEGLRVLKGTKAEELKIPKTVSAELQNGMTEEFEVKWNTENYDGNTPDTYTLKGELVLNEYATNPENLSAEIEVTVFEKAEKIIKEAAAQTDITVLAGTAFKDLKLPTTVKVTLSDDSTAELPVTWDESGYQNAAGSINVLSGTITLEEQEDFVITNPNDVKATIKVIVEEESGGGDEEIKNLALKRPVTASSSSGNFVPENAVDGNNTSTFWRSLGTATESNPEWIAVELESLSDIYEVEITLPTAWSSTYPFIVQVMASEDGETYEPVTEPTDCTLIGTSGGNGNRAFAYKSEQPFKAKYVKLVYTKCSYNVNLGELYINGKKAKEEPVEPSGDNLALDAEWTLVNGTIQWNNAGNDVSKAHDDNLGTEMVIGYSPDNPDWKATPENPHKLLIKLKEDSKVTDIITYRADKNDYTMDISVGMTPETLEKVSTQKTYQGSDGANTPVSVILDEGKQYPEKVRYVQIEVTHTGDNSTKFSEFQIMGKKAETEPTPITYKATVENGEGSGDYEEGTTVSIKATVPEGKLFDKWVSEDGIVFANAQAADTTFVMPKKDVKVTATFKDKPGPVDKSELQAVYDESLKITAKGDYTEDSWSTFDNARMVARLLLDNQSSQSDVDNAKRNLQNAMDNLVSVADLRNLYNTYKDMVQGNYTDASWNTFVTARDNAKAVLDNPKATQDEVNAAKEALENAYAGLVENAEPVDKSGLQALYDEYKDLEQGNYTDESWNVFAAARDAAKTVLDNEEATQGEVDAAKTALGDAYNALEELLDKSGLQGLYDQYKDLEQGNYTDESWEAFQKALGAAQEALENAKKQTELDTAEEALNAAYEGLKEKVDKSDLENLYNECKDLEQGNYTDESWNAFVTARDTAKTVLENSQANQEVVNAAKDALESAYKALEEKPDSGVILDALEEVLNNAKGIDRDAYTEESLAVLDEAIANAEAVLAKAEEATEEEIQAAMDMLAEAMEGLVEKSGWIETEDGWIYYTDGEKAVGWKEISGTWYYFDENGIMETGWLSEGNTWYYLNKSGAMETGWVSVNGHWYYMDQWGAMMTGWALVSDNWYYLNKSGAMETGWVSVNGHWYYMDQWGAMMTGWVLVGDNWYYLNNSGAMETGWVSVNGHWYYMDQWGAMMTGWALVGDNWYYLNKSGAMETGWVFVNGHWYYMDQWGAMMTGWVLVGNDWYYLNTDGSMATSQWIEGYYVDASGKMA